MNKLIDIIKIETREELYKNASEIAASYDMTVDENTKLFCFFGDPASHSKSPKMYNEAFKHLDINGFYFASRVPEGNIKSAIKKVRELGIKGLNISMPHKASVIDELDEVAQSAILCNAVNTIVCTDENNRTSLKGYNTDSIGAVKALLESGVEIKDKRIVLLGLGGAGKSIAYGLASHGAAHVFVFVRNLNKSNYDFINNISQVFPHTVIEVGCFDVLPSKAEISGNNLDFQKDIFINNTSLKDAIKEGNILINATSVGMHSEDSAGKSDSIKELTLIPDESYLHKDLSIMDVIYAPDKTELLLLGEAAGCKVLINGLKMLRYQGEEAFKLFTGMEASILP